MFTGIIEELGHVEAIERTDGGARLTVVAPRSVADLSIGDSIAVNGTCLTAVHIADGRFEAEAVLETLTRTNLGDLAVGSPVNLERPMRADGRFDGHIVQGHVDGVGTVAALTEEGDGYRLTVAMPSELAPYVVEKGSITIDGISLTVAALGSDAIEVAIIPHTMQATVLGTRQVGDRVNLEVDVVAKYVERMLGAHR